MTSSVAISKSFNEIKRRKKESNSISISSSDLPPVPSFLLSSSNYSNLYYEDNFSDDDEVIIIEDDGIELEDVYVEIEEQYVSSPPSNKSEAFHSNENLTPNHRNNSKNKRENSPSYSPKLSFVRNDKLEHILGKRKELSLGDKIPIELILSAFNKPNSTQFISSTDNDNNFGNLRNFNNSYIENNLKSCDFSSRNNFDVLGEEDKKSIEIAQPTLLIKDEPEFNETVEIITEEIVQHPQLPVWLHEPLRFPNLSEEEKRNLMSSVSEFPSFPIVEIPTRKNHKMNGGRGGRRYPNYPQKHLSFYKFNALESFHEFPKSACDLLEDELTSFYNWISPTPFEMENRMNTIHDITSVITNLFPNVEVAVYGSVATELCLPTSDIDMVIMNGGNWSLNLLFTQLKSELIEREICSENEIKIIYSAMVPIIKLVHKCGIPVDISFGNRSFLNNLSVVKNYLQKYDYAKPIIFFLKQLLHQQNLNITYSGGLGSYSLVIIVIHFIQINDKITNIGELLLRFLQCYGYSFDYSKFGISCYHQGSYFLKEEKNWFSTWSPNLLAVEDPLDEENDLGRKAFNIQEVRSLFADVYKKIVDTIITGSEGPSSSSIIGQIINNVSRIQQQWEFVGCLYTMSRN